MSGFYLRKHTACGTYRILSKLAAGSAFCCLSLLPTTLFLAGVPNAKGPAIEISFPNYSFSEPATSVRELDLKNGQVVFFREKGRTSFQANLRQGAYEKSDSTGGDSVKLEWVTFLGNGSGEPDNALAYYTWVSWAGSTSDFGAVQLLRVDGGHLKVVQQLLFNLRGSEKAGAYFHVKSNALTIRGVNDWEHCCPTGLDVVRFQLRDDVLKQVYYGKAPLK